ncbi:hypothetical protein EDF62_1594 [Leucobacter luti]|uniref:Uncharacterized protein n=1 Tax=Leucobacter luti TaxID=340320 RepID=A0A4R6S0B5_9MICO|nr:ATP-binding protein [Leucobacter luti]TDP92387.1 hypothetical protein EDF62_1594 [Leucobacter luti]
MRNPFQAKVFSFRKTGSPVVSSAEFVQRSASVIPNIPSGATFIARRTERGLEHLLVTDDDPGQVGAAFAVAQAVHAESVELEEAPDLGEASEIARLFYGRRSQMSMATAAGVEVTTIAEIIGHTLQMGDWVAVSVRRPYRREPKVWKRWLTSGLGVMTNPTIAPGQQVAQIWAGSDHGNAGANARAIAGAFPGFGVQPQAARVTGMKELRRSWAVAGALLTVGLLARFVSARYTGIPYVDLNGWVIGAGAALSVYSLLAAGVIPGFILPGPWKRLRRQLSWGRVPVAPRKYDPVKAPTPATTDRETGAMIPATEGEYPLARTAFAVAPHYALSIVIPHAGAFSNVGATAQRSAPPALTVPAVGPQIGVSDDAPAFLSWTDLWAGTFLIGRPGSGKTALMEWVWGESCKQVASGKQLTPVAFDTKGDGEFAKQLSAWGAEHGSAVREFHVADRSAGVSIDLFPSTGDAYSQARRIVDTFVYLYGEVSVGARSKDTLSRVFQAALAMTPDVVDGLAMNGQGDIRIQAGKSPFYYANVLLGGLGDAPGVMLADRISAVASTEGATQEIVDASQGLAPLYGGGATPAKRRDLVEAPRNKVSALLGMEHWWSAPNKVSWRDLLHSHEPVVVNTGVAPNGDQPSDQQIVEDMGSLLLYSLKLAIQEHCRGWQAQERAVRIFSDEVKAVAAASPEVVKWMRSDGRAFGVEAIFATQQPRQLPIEVRQEVMTFGNLIAFTQNDPATAREIADDLSLDGSEWEPQDVATLPKFHAIVRATFEQNRQAPFTAEVPDFRAKRMAVLAPAGQPETATAGVAFADISGVGTLTVAVPSRWEQVQMPGRLIGMQEADENSYRANLSVTAAPESVLSPVQIPGELKRQFSGIPGFELTGLNRLMFGSHAGCFISGSAPSESGERLWYAAASVIINGVRVDMIGAALESDAVQCAALTEVFESVELG